MNEIEKCVEHEKLQHDHNILSQYNDKIMSIYYDFILFHIIKLCRNKNIRGIPAYKQQQTFQISDKLNQITKLIPCDATLKRHSK